MSYRIYPREGAKKGAWYFTVDCGACGTPIYFIEDKSEGKSPAQLMGNGVLSIPCQRCGNDQEYGISDVRVEEANEDETGPRPERVAVSKAPRQPISRIFPDAKATFGIGLIEDRPKAAAIVGRVVTSWTDVEVQCARLLAELMGTNIRAAAAVFGSLRSSRAQFDALNAAAMTMLSEQDLDLFGAYMKRRSELEKQRNNLAHGCFGVVVGLPDHIVWVRQTDYLSFTATVSSGDLKEAQEEFRSKQFIYEIGTLERIAQEIEEYYNQLRFFTGYLTARHDGQNGAAFRTARYTQLCDQAHIRQALDLILAGKAAD